MYLYSEYIPCQPKANFYIMIYTIIVDSFSAAVAALPAWFHYSTRCVIARIRVIGMLDNHNRWTVIIPFKHKHCLNILRHTFCRNGMHKNNRIVKSEFRKFSRVMALEPHGKRGDLLSISPRMTIYFAPPAPRSQTRPTPHSFYYTLWLAIMEKNLRITLHDALMWGGPCAI